MKLNDHIKAVISEMGKNEKIKSVKFELYLSDHEGELYVVRSYISGSLPGSRITFEIEL